MRGPAGPLRCVTDLSIEEIGPDGRRDALSSALETFRPRVPDWTPFHEPSHLDLWMRHLSEPGSGRTVVAWDGSGSLVGYAPFMRVRDRLGPMTVPTLRFIGNNIGYPGDILRGQVFAAPPDGPAVEAILAHVASRWPLGRWDLGYMPASSPTRRAASGILGDGLVDSRSLPGVPFASVDLPEDWDAYLASLTGNTRSTYRRCLRHLERRGGVKVVIDGAPEKARDRVAQLIRNHERWHAGTAKETWFGNHAAKAFFVASSELLAREGRYVAAALEVDGTPIAWIVGPVYDGTYYEHIGSFDRAYSEWSPGVILGMELMRELISRGFRRVDLGPGSSLFKTRLGAVERPHVRVQGHRGWLRRAARLRARLRGPWAR